MSRILSAFLSLNMIVSSAYAGDPKDFKALSDTPGMRFYHPHQIYSGAVQFKEIPELRDLNSQTISDLQKLSWQLEAGGIAIGLGDNPTRDSQFDLYNPVSIDIGMKEPAAEFSVPQESREAEMGKWHFGTHDTWHTVYIPGPRLEDISTPEKLKESKKKMKKLLLVTEAYATTLSASRHAMWYWNWRNRQTNANDIETFEKYNKGLYSVSRMTEGDFYDIIEAVMLGKVRQFAKTWNAHYDENLYKNARAAGVPMLFPSFKPYLGEKGEQLFLKRGFGIVAGLANYLAPSSSFGYKSFSSYADMQVDYYLQPWYVKWADMFQVGQDFDTAEALLARKISDIKNGRAMSDITKPVDGQFEIMHTKNATEQLGRKIIELQEMIRQQPAQFSAETSEKLNDLLYMTQSLHKELLAKAGEFKKHGAVVTPAEIEKFQGEFKRIVSIAEAQLPIEQILPKKLRLPIADYSTFWRDAYGVVIPRPAMMTKFLSSRGIWEAARKQRVQRMQAELRGKPAPVITFVGESITDIENKMGSVYEKSRKGGTLPRTTDEKTEYLNALETFRGVFAKQSMDIFWAQMREFGEISIEDRKNIYDATYALVDAMNRRIQTHKSDYEKVFLTGEATVEEKARFLSSEADLKWAAEKSLHMMSDTLELSDFGKPVKAVKKYTDLARKISTALNQGKPVNPSLKDIAYHLLPAGKGKLKAICSLVTRMCFNQGINKIVDSISTQAISRSETDIKAAAAKVKPAKIPSNAAVVIVMNHENAIGDLQLLKAVSDKLGVPSNTIVTTQYAWPQARLMKNKDEKILFIEEANLTDKVMGKLENGGGAKVSAVTIYPEGNLPFWSANFPVSAKFGAFSIARKAAIRLSRQGRPVYLVKVISNFHEHTTSKTGAELKVEVAEPVLVPTHDLTGNDNWIADQRLAFENEVSAKRGSTQVDLIERQRVNGGVWGTAPVQEYVPGVNAMEVVGDDWRPSCKKILEVKKAQ